MKEELVFFLSCLNLFEKHYFFGIRKSLVVESFSFKYNIVGREFAREQTFNAEECERLRRGRRYDADLQFFLLSNSSFRI